MKTIELTCTESMHGQMHCAQGKLANQVYIESMLFERELRVEVLLTSVADLKDLRMRKE